MSLELVSCQCHVDCVSTCYYAILALYTKTLHRVEDISGREDNREIQMRLLNALSVYLYVCKIEASLSSLWITSEGPMARKMGNEFSNKTCSFFYKPMLG